MPSPDRQELLDCVTSALDAVFDTAGEYEGLAPAVLDCQTAKVPDERPAQIPDHRDSELSYPGASLLDDGPLLSTARALDAAGVERYDDAIDRYLDTFVSECLGTETGLFPWGDHAFWHLEEWRIGSCYDWEPAATRGVHDQRIQFPTWLWRELADRDPAAVQSFADGLDWHWVDEDRTRFSRHAWLDQRERNGWAPEDRSCDFPRHSGTFVHDLAVAYEIERRETTRRQLERFLDYWWHHRDDRGLLPYESEGYDSPSPQQTLALSSALCTAAPVLEEPAPDLAATARERAETYATGFLRAAHDGGRLWGADYPNEVLAAEALTCVHLWRHLGDERLRQLAEGVGELYRGLQFPQGVSIPASDPGIVLELFVDLWDVTGADRWEAAAFDLAGSVLPRYLDGAVPQAATGADHYDAHHGTGTLLHALARLALGSENFEGEAAYVRRSPGYHRTEGLDR